MRINLTYLQKYCFTIDVNIISQVPINTYILILQDKWNPTNSVKSDRLRNMTSPLWRSALREV